MNNDGVFTILIVDDEKSNLAILSRILDRDYKLLIAKNGVSALKIAKERQPDLILLDVLMPDISGFDVLISLKNIEATQAIPVIFITGLDSVKDEAKGFLLGAVDYITKPFDNTVVRARVNTHAQIVRQIRTIEKLTLLDPLTNIPNVRKFYAQIKLEWDKAIKEKTPVSMMMIDADWFKQYNDTYGHPQGDVLLKALAKTLMVSIDSPPDLIARMGGEEFAIILPGADLEEAMYKAEILRSCVEEVRVPRLSDNTPTSITASIGVATALPWKSDLIEDLMSQADVALYKAKSEGRNRVASS